MIKIASGWSNPGGSTTSWINLTNALNKYGYETTFYGPHAWHLDKCKSNILGSLNILPDDKLILHFLSPQFIKCDLIIFSSHEQNIFPIKNVNYKLCDKLHFVSEHQMIYHRIFNFPSFVIPNIVDDLKESENPEDIYGIIGSIDRNKNVHLSIKRAIKDGAKQILIYGNITDKLYYQELVEPFLNIYKNKIKMMGYCEDKQKMYDSVSRIYQDSKMETWGYIKAECIKTNTEFYGNKTTENIDIWKTENIINAWLKELKLRKL